MDTAPNITEDRQPPVIYAYSPVNGRLLGEAVADPSPLEPGVWLIPANSTDKPPPATVAAGHIAFFKNQNWVVEADPTTVISLGDAKASKLEAINAAFADTLGKGFAVSLGFTMDAHLDDLQKLKTGYDFAKIVSETKMTVVDYDNAPHPDMPLADVETILKEVGGNYRALYLTKQQLRGQVDTAATAEAVAAVVWPQS